MSGPRRHEIDTEERAIEQRIERRLAEVRELMRKSRAILEEWRAKGILPPEEPRRRI
jgi:hypothetical protein